MRRILSTMIMWGLCASCIGLIVNLFHPYRIDYIRKPPPPVVEDPAVPDPIDIDVTMAYNFYEMGEYLFVDGRSRVQYEEGHIASAISLPWEEYEKFYTATVPSLHSKPGLVVYCAGAACDLSHALARKLLQNGFPEVYVFFGGWEAWNEMGYPTEEGL